LVLHAASLRVPSLDDAPERVLRGFDVEPYDGSHQRCPVFEAMSFSLQIRQSKADQFGRGQVRIHQATGLDICPVEALREHAKQNPHWVNGRRMGSPGMRSPTF
jgi:hypothetical protein